MKLLHLNLRSGGQNRTDSLIKYIIDHQPDLLVLGEFQDNKNGQKIKNSLKNEGYYFKNCADYQRGVLVASKHKFSIIKIGRRLVGIELNNYNLKLLGVYVPTDKYKKFKKAVWRKILKFAYENRDINSIITGDLNSCTKDDSMNQTHYNAKELKKLRSFGWIDAWSHNNNDESDRYTWYSNNGNGFRLDYAFLSPNLVKGIRMIHFCHDTKSREEGMTDHSPIILDISV